MNHDLKHEKVPGHGDYERRDIGVAGVLYFLLGLLVAGGIAHFIVQGVYHYLDNHYETRQPPVSPLVKNILLYQKQKSSVWLLPSRAS